MEFPDKGPPEEVRGRGQSMIFSKIFLFFKAVFSFLSRSLVNFSLVLTLLKQRSVIFLYLHFMYVQLLTYGDPIMGFFKEATVHTSSFKLKPPAV